MALEDRDWYRDMPSEAWRKLFPKHGGTSGSGANPPTASRTRGSNDPTAGTDSQPRRVRPRRHGSFVWGWIAPLALAAAVGVGFAAWRDHDLPWQNHHGSVPASPALPKAPPARQQTLTSGVRVDAGKVIRFRSRPGLDTPATRVTRWSVTDPRFGRVSVYVPVGTTPREALTRALAAKGYQVLP